MVEPVEVVVSPSEQAIKMVPIASKAKVAEGRRVMLIFIEGTLWIFLLFKDQAPRRAHSVGAL
jgi:hypothetical protein